MTFNEYQQKATSTRVDKDPIIYPALGLGNEAGEVQGKVKKILRDSDGIFTEANCDPIASELGDVLWYLAVLANDLGYSLETIAEKNIKKLEDRKARGVIQGSGDNR